MIHKIGARIQVDMTLVFTASHTDNHYADQHETAYIGLHKYIYDTLPYKANV